MTNNEFYVEVEKLGIKLTSIQKDQLEKYYELLTEWNQKINLTAITDKQEVYLKHFYDSITLCRATDLSKEIKVCDIGTGAGFPGLVLKIVFPNLKLTLVDALNKRINFLKTVIKELNLNQIEVIHARAEEYAATHREQFDLVTSRAVANLKLLTEYSLPLVKVTGEFIPMKADIAQEIIGYDKTLKIVSGKLEQKIIFELPNQKGTRTLLKVKKEKITPKQYPRSYAIMKKRPL